MRLVLIFVVSLLWGIGLFAQEEKNSNIVTDRSSQTQSAFTMPKGYFQWETGFSYIRKPGLIENDFGAFNFVSEVESYTYNHSLLRYGLSDKIELRLIQTVGQDRTSNLNEDTKFGPTFIGAKFELMKQAQGRPQISFLTHIGTPLLESGDEGVQFDFRFNFDIKLSNKLNLAYNLGGIYQNDQIMEFDSGSNFKGLYTLVLGYRVIPKLLVFGELFGFWENTVEADHRVDFGLTYLLSPNVQLDFFTGTGLELNSAGSPDSLFGFGFSLRIPKN